MSGTQKRPTPHHEWRQRVASPRIEVLRRELEERPEAISEFWASVAESDAPLVEEIPGDDDARCVTFVYRDVEGDLDHVVLGGWIVLNDYADNRLLRVGDSDLMALSLRLPRDTRTEYLLAPNRPLSPVFDPEPPFGLADVERFGELLKSGGPDRLNPNQSIHPYNAWKPEAPLVYSLLELPDAAPKVWSVPPAVDEHSPELHEMVHESARGGIRRLWFCTVGTAPPERLLVVLDGFAFLHLMQTPAVLTRLHRRGLIPPVAAVFVDSGTEAMRGRDYMGSRAHSEYLADDIVGMAARRFGMTPTARTTMIYGMSAGGLTALVTGFRRPEVFGNILALSTPAMVANDDLPDGVSGLAQSVAPHDLPRVHLYAGRLEVDRIAGSQVLSSNRDLCYQLQELGFDAALDEVSCGHGLVDLSDSVVKGLLRLLATGKPN